MNEFEIRGKYITITQLLKVLGYSLSGGEAKFFLLDKNVSINGHFIQERRKKIYKGDIVTIEGNRYKMI